MSGDIKASRALRLSLLKSLYAARKKTPGDGWCWRRELEQDAGAGLEFDLGYLTERGYINNDGPKFRITATGMDFIEENNV